MKRDIIFVGLALAAFGASASGFGLYEASAPSYALGGAAVGRAIDASANFFNPATLTDLRSPTLTLGFMTEHPRGRMKSDLPGGRTSTMDPGMFLLPHFHFATPLFENLAFGLGVMPEYGLGSKYDNNWDLSFNSIETTVTSITLNPNLAWKIGDFSVGAGLRFLFFDFEQYSNPYAADKKTGMRFGRFHNRLKGDNGMKDLGYQIGLRYDVLDNLAVGIVYKSMTRVQVEGKSCNDADTPDAAGGYAGLAARATSGHGAHTTIDLPQSITAGFNWDITDKWHLGGTLAWTEWSSVGQLSFHLPGQAEPKPIRLEWEDTWRVALAPSWDFAEDWTLMGSYVFETDCCGEQNSTMLPPSERHMISLGLLWRFADNLDLSLVYGMILMNGKDSVCTEPVSGETYRYSAHRALSHAAGFTLTYRF